MIEIDTAADRTITARIVGWRLVTSESARSEHNAVRRMDDRLSRDDNRISPFNWRPGVASKHPDWEAWLWGKDPLGGAIFTEGGLCGAAWHLDRVAAVRSLRSGRCGRSGMA